jgi:hypothetical protein
VHHRRGNGVCWEGRCERESARRASRARFVVMLVGVGRESMLGASQTARGALGFGVCHSRPRGGFSCSVDSHHFDRPGQQANLGEPFSHWLRESLVPAGREAARGLDRVFVRGPAVGRADTKSAEMHSDIGFCCCARLSWAALGDPTRPWCCSPPSNALSRPGGPKPTHLKGVLFTSSLLQHLSG